MIQALVTRGAEHPDGMPTRPCLLTVRSDGHDYRIQIDVPPYSTPEVTTALGHLICDSLPGHGESLRIAEERAAEAEASAKDSDRRAHRYWTDMRRVLHGGFPRCFGRVLVVVRPDGAWVQDPEKRDRGYGFRLPDLATLWRQWPELRPVEWGADERGPFLICEAFALGEDCARP